ncbi:MAG: hypothetical protein F4018_15435 [Acidobacteria bacterium]|nr:hypothetical protein [Acidobacteriota bacterium]MYH31387.1 hypothetical protein [Acidobacteriota bacterium]MYK89611.1 hypothetical protein [Acidobacteriota bacterium]
MEQEWRPIRIDRPVQLLVEGKDPENFFEKFITRLELKGTQVQNFRGVDELKGFLEGFVVAPGFGQVKSIGIVRDAERRMDRVERVETQPSSAASAFQSVQSSLRNVGLPVPNRPTEEAGTEPAVSVFILPGNEDDGMLETLLCRTFAETDMDRCVDGFFQCVAESGSRIHRPDKARARAYLTTMPHPHVSVGVAAQKGYWDFDHEALDGVRRFLMALAQDRPAA